MVGIKIWIFDVNLNNYYFYHVNDLFYLVMCTKVLYLLTIITYKSKYGSTRSYRVCNMFGTRAGPKFIMKCLLRDSPLFYIICILFSGVFFFGWTKNIAESPIDRLNLGFQEHSFYNSCWESIVTMSSVGYGDIYPKTYLGRIISFLEIIFGVSVISMSVVTLNNSMIMETGEANAYTVLKRLEIREMIKDSAIKILIA